MGVGKKKKREREKKDTSHKGKLWAQRAFSTHHLATRLMFSLTHLTSCEGDRNELM